MRYALAARESRTPLRVPAVSPLRKLLRKTIAPFWVRFDVSRPTSLADFIGVNVRNCILAPESRPSACGQFRPFSLRDRVMPGPLWRPTPNFGGHEIPAPRCVSLPMCSLGGRIGVSSYPRRRYHCEAMTDEGRREAHSIA